jgi:streptogramin lyase
MTKTILHAGGCAVALAALAACGGGGGGSSSGGVPATPVPTSSGVPVGGTAVARLTLTEPVTVQSAGTARTRRPLHLPPTTKSVVVSVNGATVATFNYLVNGPTCVVASGTLTCTYDAPVPAGNDTITVQTLNAKDKVLSTATVQQTIAGTTVVPITLLGVPATAQVSFNQKNTSPLGTPATVPLTVTAYDVDSNTISGAYATPIALSDNDTSGHSSVSPASVASSTTAVGMITDGKALNVRIAPSGINGSGDLYIATVVAHEYAVPSGTVAAANAGTGTIVLGGDGAMWFGLQNGIGRADAAGTIAEYPMVQPQQLVRGPDGAVWFTTYFDSSTGVSGKLVRAGAGGTVTKLGSGFGARMTVGADNNFWIVDGNAYVTRVTPAGAATQFSLTTPSGFGSNTTDIAAGPDGNLWILDTAAGRLYTVSTGGSQVASIALTPLPQSGIGGARMTFGADGALWLTSQLSVIRVTTSGATSEYNQLGGFLTAFSGVNAMAPIIAASDGNVWSTGSSFAQKPALFRIAPNGAAVVLLLPPPPSIPSYGGIVPVGIGNGPNGSIWYVRGSSVGWFTPPS